LTGLLIEAFSLVEKLAAMVSPFLTIARWRRLVARLRRNPGSGRNGRNRTRKGKGCQEFLGVRRNDQAADSKSVSDQVTITIRASTLGSRRNERLSQATD
jgi:hypothetical protein